MAIKKTKAFKIIKFILFLIIFGSSFYLYSRYLGIKGIRTNEISIVDSNIPNSFYGFKIVHISDIHYNVTTDKNDLIKLVKEINLLKPDIVLLSGDLFDSSIKYSKKDYQDIKKILKSINYNISKFAIKGEDDLNINEWNSIMSDSDFIDLNDKYELIYNEGLDPILLVGISSNYKNNNIKNTLNTINSEIKDNYKYSILLLHEPDIIDKIDYNKFNLILAGHNHGGQIKLPFIGGIIKDKYSKKYINNFYRLKDSKMYISSGIGTSKYKLRFLNKPSINFYRLRNN